MKVLIVDNERVARFKVRSVLETVPDVTEIMEAADGPEAIEQIVSGQPDLVLLDVQLPELSGFEVVRAVGLDRMPPVVFVTAYDRYAIQAFDVEALDYVVKPFDRERLVRALDRVRRWLNGRQVGLAAYRDKLELPLERVGQPPPLERVVVPGQNRSLVLPVRDIDWIEAADNYVRLHVCSRYHLVRGKFSRLEVRIGPTRFTRVHRCAIVNLERVVELRAGLRGDVVVLRDGRQIPVGATRREAVMERLGMRL